MTQSDVAIPQSTFPTPSVVLELLKPITWFAPMWAFLCGVVSSGVPLAGRWQYLVAGIVLAGPLLCATSQAANDWFDRHVDAINEPQRPIPSGRLPGSWGLYVAIFWSTLSVVWAVFLGPWVLGAALVGLVLAWVYSAPPLRLKQSGWWGPAAAALSYEGIAWFAGAAVMTHGLPDGRILFLAAAYSWGAHGIMTLNDFKAVEGDARMGIRSLPVELGVDNAALIACAMMALPQLIVFVRIISWGRPLHAALVGAAVTAQMLLMARLLRDPRANAPWYNATGTLLYVLGMLSSAFALRSMGAG